MTHLFMTHIIKAESMLAQMKKFLDTMEQDETEKIEKEKSKKRKKIEKNESKIEPSESQKLVEFY